MTYIINLTRHLNIILVITMNIFISSGSFLENFLHYTSIHMKKHHTNNNVNGLDPLHFERSISMSDSNLRLDLSFNGFLKGYTDYDIHTLKITPDLNVSFVGTLVDTQVSGSYKMNGSYFTVFPILGDGLYLFKLKNINLALNTKIEPKDGRIQILGFDMDYIFEDLEISLWGLTGDQAVGNILQEFTKDFIAVVLHKRRHEITNHVKSFVLEEGNAKLKNMTLANMIELAKDIFVY
ncbi:uncharacterized protein [Halyomorpha halys]|uniref:uncharacterized protein n=1 Tax=Halyomorpha halys TaxID=286706 RepID=UPI0006D4DA17|nr:uncharacterized protein LOC106683279 [Halyomorpha halys]